VAADAAALADAQDSESFSRFVSGAALFIDPKRQASAKMLDPIYYRHRW